MHRTKAARACPFEVFWMRTGADTAVRIRFFVEKSWGYAGPAVVHVPAFRRERLLSSAQVRRRTILEGDGKCRTPGIVHHQTDAIQRDAEELSQM
jgi:hypothetical protein